ncbi:MAG: GGDEF domain-containing protein [Lachnospiraceae bacterium]|nr:GGDEF domain-containing protein [Lachnospiraceae bacterium]
MVNIFHILKSKIIKRGFAGDTENTSVTKKVSLGIKASGSLNNKRVIVTIAIVVALAVGFNIAILVSLNDRNANNTLDVVLNQVVSRLERNYQEDNRLVSSLKEEYIVKAQTVSYILDQKPELKDDLLELLIIAGKMGIDEIHLFNDEGVIFGGTLPEYYGVSFGDGEQISYFMPMLSDKYLTMCQDVTPNTAEGRNMMYAITWNSSHDYMVQIGIEPKRLFEELKRNELSTVISAMPAYEGIEIFVADKITGDIGGATNKNYIGKSIKALGIEISDSSMTESMGISNVRNGYKHFYRYKQWGDYIVIISYSTEKDLGNFFVYMLMMLIYLSLASIVIYVMVGKIAKTIRERNDQLSILVSMSEVYYSMHLIDLEENTVKEYAASETVREVVNKTDGADEMMRKIISETVCPEYLDAVLEFTDLHTLADRMVGRKIITEEFNGNQFGWCRASFITIEADENDRPRKVIFVTRDIDKDKQKEE